MSKVAIVGEEDIILGFKALGADAFCVSNNNDARKTVGKLTRSDYSIVFILERWAEATKDLILESEEKLFPVFVYIPDHRGSLNLAREKMRRAMEKAIGVSYV